MTLWAVIFRIGCILRDSLPLHLRLYNMPLLRPCSKALQLHHTQDHLHRRNMHLQHRCMRCHQHHCISPRLLLHSKRLLRLCNMPLQHQHTLVLQLQHMQRRLHRNNTDRQPRNNRCNYKHSGKRTTCWWKITLLPKKTWNKKPHSNLR